MDIDFKKSLYSPLNNKSRVEVINDIRYADNNGMKHILYYEYDKLYGYSKNILVPYLEENNTSVNNLIIINNPEDALKLAETHVKKSPYLKKYVYDSIISTTDNNNWSEQRSSYQTAFSVENQLKKIIPISNSRAITSLNYIFDYKKSCDSQYVNIYHFFLNETMAQLQIAMFGFSDEFQKRTNVKIRNAFSTNDTEYAAEFVQLLLNEIDKSTGPLSLAMKNRNLTHNLKKEKVGNALIFPFAGHDTTANTLTWLIYELCCNSHIYKNLQNEVDKFWKNKNDENIHYTDFKLLPYMTRCIMETLRLWTSIPNGTSRELESDEYIIGKEGELVMIPKGTYIQIPNWTRHHNPLLWGDDVNIFNPDRDFKDDELWNDSVFASYNPNSERFSPFSYGPRDCIGKNFSQIEMRIILLHLLKNFTFSLPEIQKNTYTKQTLSFNKATLAPRNIFNESLSDQNTGMFVTINYRNLDCKL